MKRNIEWYKDYHIWKEKTLKPCCKANWKSKGHIRYLMVSKAAIFIPDN